MLAPMEITFLRHGRSEANEAGIWQGRRNGGRLTSRGVQQAAAVARRFLKNPPDLLITSGLARTDQTAAPFGLPFEHDDGWAEMDLGEWDGLSFESISEMYGDELLAVFTGQPVPMGRTGETVLQVRERLSTAMEALESRLDEGDRALVVTHGGVVETLARLHWKIDDPSPLFAGPENTSLTSFRRSFGRLRLATFNDTGHLGPLGEWAKGRHDAGDPVITFVRHGETDANLQQRVQGQTDWGLNDRGRAQAERLAAWYGKQDVVFSSPLGRAIQTAEALALSGPNPLPEFAELSFGEWEGMTFDEVRTAEGNSELADRIFRLGEDLPRGGSGETWDDLRRRMQAGVDQVAALNGSRRVTIVSHGGAIRAYTLGNLGVGWPEVLETIVPANTAVSHVVVTTDGPILADYAVATHLE